MTKPHPLTRFLVLLAVLFTMNLSAQNLAWTSFTDSIVTFSSPRCANLNGDSVLDVVLGGGVDGMTTPSGVIALNGINGNRLWRVETTDEIFGSPIFYDITGDTIDDVFIGGRNAEFMAINGATGAVIWEFFPQNTTVNPGDSGWYNFYSPQWIADQSGDGIPDIFVANGGDHSKLPSQTNRDPGHLLVLNAANGNIISKAVVPDSAETYCSAVVSDLRGDGTDYIIFGTGGEYLGGSMWVDSLSNLLNNDLSGATAIMTDNNKGFIAPPSVADLNMDGILDIVVQAFGGEVRAVDGDSLTQIWEYAPSGLESSATPVIGNFTGGFEPDVFLVLARGLTPSYFDYYQIMLDGADGSEVHKDSIGAMHFAPPVAADLNADGRDELFVSLNTKSGANFSNQFYIIDFGNGNTSTFMSAFLGTNLASTPWIGDMDQDGVMEILNVRRKASVNPIASEGIYVQRINTFFSKPATGIAWGGYIGSNADGHYVFDTSGCTNNTLTLPYTSFAPTCNGLSDGSINVFPQGGTAPYTYQWANGQIGFQAINLNKGKYAIQVVDANGCVRRDSLVLFDPYTISFLTQDVTCYGDTTGVAEVISTGCQCLFTGCSFRWGNEDTVHTTTGLSAGWYHVTVTHASGCAVVDSVFINQGPKLIDTVLNTRISCLGANDGKLEVVPHNPLLSFGYNWDTGDSSKDITSLSAGRYKVTVTNVSGCVDSADVEVLEPDSLFLSAMKTDVLCYDSLQGTINAQGIGGWQPYSFLVNGMTYNDTLIDSLAAGTYIVQLIDSANCLAFNSDTLVIDQPDSVSVTSSQSEDYGGSEGWISVNTSGGTPPYSYVWDPGGDTTDSIFGLSTGSYTLTITDGNVCVTTVMFDIQDWTGIEGLSDADISIFPNPASDKIVVRSSKTLDISLIDIRGKLVRMSSGDNIEMDVVDLPRGSYLILSGHKGYTRVDKIILK